ncbi:MAG: Hsp70 family protein [Deltaproteobacteria bacterium]|nr:Hsp70 family protein [Deltaproteobacteria bacterium]
MEPIVGIDLGTTNSEIAFIINKNAEIIKDNDNGIVPSCVGLGDNEEIIVGMEALNRFVLAPDATVLSVKRLMGTTEKIVLKDSSYLPQEISAFILKALKERAEKKIKQTISKAVITVPAYFTDVQRNATKEAGEIAGMEVVRIINEPTAAALAYESDNPDNQRILVYDLGGGTFDVSIVKIENGVVEVLSSTGDNHLGGDDFDMKIVDLLVTYLSENNKISVTNDKTVMARLKRAAIDAKITLSNLPYAKIEEDHIAKKGWKDIHLSYELSRIDFEEMIDEYLSRTNDSISKALKDAALLPSAIDKIILVGGSTRIPKISEMIEKKFGKLPHSEIDPDLCVALGAAIQAGREMGMDSSSVLLDITPYTFGTSAIGYIDSVYSLTKFVPMIRRNSKLPAGKSEAFYTAVDNQEKVDITVYQGEEPNALGNVLIGTYSFTLSKAPSGSVIILRFELDINGILKIEAIEKESGKKINAVVENALSEFSGQDLAASKAKIEQGWGKGLELLDKNGSETIMPDEINKIIEQAESVLEEAPEEDRDEIINLIEDIKDAIDDDRLDDAKESCNELEEILFYLG